LDVIIYYIDEFKAQKKRIKSNKYFNADFISDQLFSQENQLNKFVKNESDY